MREEIPPLLLLLRVHGGLIGQRTATRFFTHYICGPKIDISYFSRYRREILYAGNVCITCVFVVSQGLEYCFSSLCDHSRPCVLNGVQKPG